MLLIGKVVLGNLEEIVSSSWNSQLDYVYIRFTSKHKRNCCRQSLFEDLPALDDYDEKVKNVMERNYFKQQKSLSKRETEKNEEKTKPYLKLIHLLRQCVSRNVMECCMFSTANRLSKIT
jgi:hypothetical protein